MTPLFVGDVGRLGLWVFCGHYIIGVPHPRTIFSVAYSCSDMNKGSTMPALLWVFSGFMQCLTRSATPDRTRNVAAGESPKSVERYEKGAKLLRQLSFVPDRFFFMTRPPRPVTQCGDTGLPLESSAS